MSDQTNGLFNLGFGAQRFLVLDELLLLELLGHLRLDVFKLGQLGGAHIIKANDVVAELGLDRGLGQLAFAQGGQGGGEFSHVVVGGRPIKVAATGARAWVFAGFFGNFFKVATFFELGDDGLRF